MMINNLDILYAHSDDNDITYWTLGKLINNEFVPEINMGLSYVSDGDDEYIDLASAKKELGWT